MRQSACLLLVLVLSGAACATNPVSGKRQVSLMSEAEEAAIGQQQDAEVRREMGVYDDRELQRYVSDIGLEIARKSHRPNLNWTFTIVDSSAINAFALPGGYVYITRGIMAYLDDESELAGVLGHEIGHVTARHAAQAYTRQAEANFGLAVLGIFVPGAQPFTGLGSSGASVLFLKNGREAEIEADRLGVEYGSGAGYDPEGVPRFLATLARVDALSTRGVPNWLSTHPASGARVAKAEPVAAKFASSEAKTVNRNEYLEHIENLLVGDSPKDGIVHGNEFLHPLLRIGVTFPEGWEITNAAEAVMAQEPGTQHFMVLQEVSASLRQGYGGQAARSIGDVAVESMKKSGYKVVDGSMQNINGNEAHVGLYQGTAKEVGKVMMRAAHIAINRQIYIVAGFAPEKEFPQVDKEITPALQSFRYLTPQEAANVRPNRLRFYTVKQGDSWQSIAARQGHNFVNAATLAIMNDHEVSVQPQAGDRIKIIVEG